MTNTKTVLALALGSVLTMTPPAAAKLSALKVPKEVPCAAKPITVGLYAGRHHKGDRRVRVMILSTRRSVYARVHYNRRVKAYRGRPRTWQIKVPCHKSYVVNYVFPTGGVSAYLVRVRRHKAAAITKTML